MKQKMVANWSKDADNFRIFFYQMKTQKFEVKRVYFQISLKYFCHWWLVDSRE